MERESTWPAWGKVVGCPHLCCIEVVTRPRQGKGYAEICPAGVFPCRKLGWSG